MTHFKGSIFITLIGIILAYFWGVNHIHANGFLSVFVVLFLAILEVTLSFDNAVVNAMKLEKMSKIWQQRFLTWGIVIAVFGMRLLFPIFIVCPSMHEISPSPQKLQLQPITILEPLSSNQKSIF